jgi:hypothetical protein
MKAHVSFQEYVSCDTDELCDMQTLRFTSDVSEEEDDRGKRKPKNKKFTLIDM